MNGKAPPPHVTHVLEHLERLSSGISITLDEQTVFLGAEEPTHFWELVGLRLRGVPNVVLAALRFQRHDLPVEAQRWPLSSRRRAAHFGQVLGEDEPPLGIHAGALQDMVQLPHVAGKVVVLQELEGRRGDLMAPL